MTIAKLGELFGCYIVDSEKIVRIASTLSFRESTSKKSDEFQICMDANSQSAKPPDTYSHRLADIVGTAIALVTLTLPVFVIAHYSTDVSNNPQPQTYTMPIRGN